MDVIHEMASGWVALPVLDALKQQGILELLSQHTLQVNDVAQGCGADAMRLRAALGLLTQLGYLDSPYPGLYSSNARTALAASLPDELVALGKLSLFDDCLTSAQCAVWQRRLMRCIGADADDECARLWDCAILVPLLAGFGWLAPDTLEQACPPGDCAPVWQTLQQLFVHRGWAEQRRNGFALTLQGRKILLASSSLAVVVAHAPLLQNLSALLFEGAPALDLETAASPGLSRPPASTEAWAYQRVVEAFSGRAWVEPAAWLMEAAAAGQFVAPGAWRSMRQWLASAWPQLPDVSQRAYTVRPPVVDDLPQLIELDRLSQPSGLHTPPQIIEWRVRNTPQTLMVLVAQGRIAAALHAQRIDGTDALRDTTYSQVHHLHQPDGVHLQLLGLYVLPEMAGRGYSDALIECMLTYAAMLGDVQSVIGVTRCAGFVHQRESVSLEDYVRSRNVQGEMSDPMLHFHVSRGAVIREVLPGFRAGDSDNNGAGVLIEYAWPDIAVTAHEADSTPEVAALSRIQLEQLVQHAALQVSAAGKADAYSPSRPWMEMGLGSLQLLELRRRLSSETGLRLDATFLFSCPTPDAAIAYFVEHLGVPPGSSASASRGPSSQAAVAETNEDSIAIIGMACRLPGGISHPAQLWTALMQGQSLVGPMPPARRALRSAEASSFSWHAGFLNDIDRFDAGFFRISPHEAQWLDPQQRLLLEVAWEALESAGLSPRSLQGLANGIFVGMMGSEYAHLLGSNPADELEAHFATGAACSVAAGRLAYFLDWRGPALTVDTACSSSLVAVHLACRSLQTGESNIALAAGANVLLDDRVFLAFEKAGMLSPTGLCHTFDQAADGYVRAEGCAMVVLKRFCEAQADGDPILATIAASAINQDGGGAGLTAPNPHAQQSVIETALLRAGLPASAISYLEAHGTGTPLGDPIEVQAAAQVLGRERSVQQPLLIGSIKSLLGHLEAAAGIAGLLKTVLSMQHSIIPGQLNFHTANAHIPWDTLPIRVPQTAQPWPDPVKRAGVSSFGFSGTNAHLIVQAHDAAEPALAATCKPMAIVLSARTAEQLMARSRQLLAFLEHSTVDVVALAYTLQVGRDAMAMRLGFIASTLTEVKTRLADLCSERPGAQTPEPTPASSLAQSLARWLHGDEVDWHALHDLPAPRKLALPTYPFADERYWLPEEISAAPQHDTASAQLLTLTAGWERMEASSQEPVDATLSTLWLSADATAANLPVQFNALKFDEPCTAERLGARLQAQARWQQLVWRVPVSDNAPIMGFRLIQALFALGYDRQPLRLTVLTEQAHALEPREQVDPCHASVVGLMGTLAREYPHWQLRLIDLPAGQFIAPDTWLHRQADPQRNVQIWRDGVWYRHRLVPTELPPLGVSAYRRGGVYVVLGGAGGLGRVFSEYVIRCYQAQVIWLGRRAEDAQITEQCARLGTLGPAPVYLQADARDREALVRARAAIVERYGVVHGVVHAPMVLADNPLARMDEPSFLAAFLAKTTVVNLDAVFGAEGLDFFASFSSIASFLKTPGAANYVAGCCFVDAYAHNLGSRGYPIKLMHWGPWFDTGGISAPGYRTFMQQMGFESLGSDEAMAALEQLLSGPLDSVVVARARRDRLNDVLTPVAVQARPQPAAAPSSQVAAGGRGYRAEMHGMSLVEAIVWDLIEQARTVSKLPRQAIKATANLSEYGFDSILLVRLARRLSEHYDLMLWPPLFFSYPSLDQLAQYLVQFHQPLMAALYEPPGSGGAPAAPGAAPTLDAAQAKTDEQADEPIAIIGLSGRFAGARNAEQFWEILRDGRSVVQPFAPDRLADTSRQRWLAAMPGVAEFDPLFFEIAPREAALIDPRQRLLMQETWCALEDAAYGPVQLKQQTISTFVGVEAGDYGRLIGSQNTLTANHDSILAARLAYFLDLSGPTLAINTACSSSLVALHQGCLSLRSGESDTAIVAAVNLLAGTQLTDQMADAGMLAPDGVCHAFDKRAQGMAPGEAAVVVVLKRLSRAQADGDPIRGVIVGSGINGDGKTQGITAPNGRAQSSLFRKVYERYQVNPDEIEYVVSHGTGTPLGDPVEINALCDAFAPFTQRRQYCAITSNKPNVGHGLAAAGLVSVVNLLKAFEHETIPASLNCEQASDYVTWADTPFYVNTTNTSWPAADARPRLGAVSAFGMSGTNAHVLLRGPEACASAEVRVPRVPVVLAVSAKSQAALHGRIDDLIRALGTLPDNAAMLQRVAYTLLNGRQHFAWRCAIVAEDMDQAVSLWRQALRGESSAALYQGQLARDFETNVAMREDGRRLIEQAGRETSPAAMLALLSRVAERYCQGDELPWAALFDPHARSRVHLPTYPFEADPFWAVKSSEECAPAAEMPTLSSAEPWHSSVRLTGEEAFLRDHVVLGQQIVPGVVQLEWVMTAVTRYGGGAPFRLEQVAWLRPVTVDVIQDLHIALVRMDERTLGYEVYGTGQGQKRLYSQGRATLLSDTQTAPAPWLDIASLRARCTRSRDGAACYRDFAEAGLDYGSSFQVLQSLHLGDDIAVGSLHASPEPSFLLDGALQASVILGGAAGVTMPFSLESFQQWGPLTGALSVVVRRVSDDGATTRRFDIDLVDAAGDVAARFVDFSGRCTPVDSSPACGANAGLMLASRWEREPPLAQAEATDPQPLVQIGGDPQGAPKVSWQADEGSDVLIERLTPHLPLKQVVWYVPAAGTQLAVMGLRLVKALLALGYATQSLGLTVITQQAQGLNALDEVDPEQASVHGLIGSMAKEYAHWQVRLLDMAPGDSPAQATLLAQPAQPYGNARLWRQGGWYGQRLVPCQWPGVSDTRLSVFREGGVYVVLGGAGGVGVAFSEYLIKRYQAQLIWLGRRAADEPIRQQCARLAEFGPRPLYVQADGTHHDALELACVQINERFGRVHGVVHAAIVLADQSLAGMDESGFVAALSAKTLTAQNLAAVFGKQDLDFLLFFGSLQSFLKAPGQSNYAAGCCYVDALVQTLVTRRDPPSFPVKVMQWGYWGSVGVVASPFYARRMAQKGLGSIEPSQAMAALEAFLLAPVSQLVFLQKAPASTLAPELGFDPTVVPEPALMGECMLLPEQPLIPVPSALVVRGYKELERRLAQLIWARLDQLGRHEYLEPKYQRWCQATERVLGAVGLHRDIQAPSWPVLWEQWQTYREQLPGDTGLSAHVRVADAVLHALPSVLSGQQSATAVLFPQGQLHLLEGVYGNHPIADYFNAVLAERLQAYVRARLAHDPHLRLRILEVGAGTGATSASLMTHLSPFDAHIDEYCYTDISRVFLAHAQARYATGAPYLRTQLLDIEVSPLTQGFDAGQYDVVIAANVLHATRDIRRSLCNVKTLLKGNGLLLLNELSGTSVFQHLVFGLLDGWWLAEDHALRVADSPALHADSWRAVLNSEGFTAINLLAQDACELGQQIVEAISDARGFVERPLAQGPGLATLPEVERKLGSPLQVDARQVIRECVAQSLGLKDTQLHDDQTFVSCGLDSISSVALVNVINTRLSLKLPATVVFDYPTIERLDNYLKDKLHAPLAPPPVAERTVAQSASVTPAPVARLGAAEHAVATCRRILLERPGSIDEIRVVEETCAALGGHEVRIAVQAFSLNFGDLLCVKGLYPTQPAYPFTPGYEASGIVTAIGPDVCDVAVGDAVVALAGAQFGAQATLITCPQHLVFRCPTGLSFEQACAVPVAAITVIECF
ncbi:beta-ketoacyl synthase N-terminal-like domain-containing protein [Pseudomonas mucidolens]|nr:beta-ketoacyl synthase N-terminal-like domain-containing protein [Pseudomonas mucidolens]